MRKSATRFMMFSDFKAHVIGAPQIAPSFSAGTGNVLFAGPGNDEDFGLEEISRNSADRYKFRTAPLRNLAVSPGSSTTVPSCGSRTRSGFT